MVNSRTQRNQNTVTTVSVSFRILQRKSRSETHKPMIVFIMGWTGMTTDIKKSSGVLPESWRIKKEIVSFSISPKPQKSIADLEM